MKKNQQEIVAFASGAVYGVPGMMALLAGEWASGIIFIVVAIGFRHCVLDIMRK